MFNVLSCCVSVVLVLCVPVSLLCLNVTIQINLSCLKSHSFFNYPSCLAEMNKIIIFGIFQRLTWKVQQSRFNAAIRTNSKTKFLFGLNDEKKTETNSDTELWRWGRGLKNFVWCHSRCSQSTAAKWQSTFISVEKMHTLYLAPPFCDLNFMGVVCLICCHISCKWHIPKHGECIRHFAAETAISG